MRIATILGIAVVAVASIVGVACKNGDQAGSTFHPRWDDRGSSAKPASSTDQGAYGGGPKTDDRAPATDQNDGLGGIPSGVTGTGNNVDGTDPAGSHGPQAPAIDPSFVDAGKSGGR